MADGNGFTGTLPTTIGRLEDLNFLGMCKFEVLCLFDSFSPPIRYFRDSNILLVNAVAYNSMTGPIPTELGNMESLEHIVFGKKLGRL